MLPPRQVICSCTDCPHYNFLTSSHQLMHGKLVSSNTSTENVVASNQVYYISDSHCTNWLISHCSLSPSSQSSINCTHLPSVDLTSISPPSSQPPNSPPRKVKHPPFSPEPQIDILLDPNAIKQLQLPNSNSVGKARVPTRKSVRKAMNLQYWNAPSSCHPSRLSPMRN